MTPTDIVQRQLEAYNARDLAAFLATYHDDICLYRLPDAAAPSLRGRAALGEFYAANRFNLPDLHADVVNRIAYGNKVIDHERIHGLPGGLLEVAVVYEVEDGLIRRVWSVPGA